MKTFLRQRMAVWVRRRQGIDSLPVTLRRGRLYVLPTRAGLAFGVLLFFMLVAGLNYANSLALFLTFLLAGFALVTMHQCHRNLLGVTLIDAGTVPAFAGEFGRLLLTLANDSTLERSRIALDVRGEPEVSVDLPAEATQRMELPIAAPSRGVVHIERICLSTTHPFGLFRVWSWVHVPLSMTVYPRPRGSRRAPVIAGHTPGPHLRGIDAQDEWQGLRAFRDGDSPRQVAWKAYARGAPLLVKEYAASGSQLRIFDFARLEGLDTEARLEQLARWVVDAQAQGERYGVALPGSYIEPGLGLEHRHRCLAALAMHGIVDGSKERPRL